MSGISTTSTRRVHVIAGLTGSAFHSDTGFVVPNSFEFKDLVSNSVDFTRKRNLNKALSVHWLIVIFYLLTLNFRNVSGAGLSMAGATYTLSLTLAKQNLFWIQNILADKSCTGRHAHGSMTSSITRHLLKLAFKLYFEAEDWDNPLNQIREYSQKITSLSPDATIQKITAMINSSTTSDEDGVATPDESWVATKDGAWDLLSLEHTNGGFSAKVGRQVARPLYVWFWVILCRHFYMIFEAMKIVSHRSPKLPKWLVSTPNMICTLLQMTWGNHVIQTRDWRCPQRTSKWLSWIRAWFLNLHGKLTTAAQSILQICHI